MFAGGEGSSGSLNVIQYITISSTGNTTDFGDLTAVNETMSAAASSTIGLFMGGTSQTDRCEKVTIGSTGNASDFGNLSVGRGNGAGASTAHGGIA